MAEQSDNNSTNKKPPLFPPNFVTLVQLKERWDREQERKQREKEEQEKQQRREDEKKLKLVVEEGESGSRRVKGEPINRRKRPIWQSTPRNQSRKPEVSKLAIESAVTDAESQGLKDIKKKKSGKGKNKKKGKIEDKARAENEDVIRGGENEEVIRGGGNVEVIRGEEEAPSCQNVEKEIVPKRREWWPRAPRTDFRPTIRNTSRNEIVEIEKKFDDLSVDGGNRRDHRYSRPKRYPNGRNSDLGRDYWRTPRHSERNGTNAGMMWVKRREVGDRNVVEIQSSSPLPKGLK